MRWMKWIGGAVAVLTAGFAALFWALLPPDIAAPPRTDRIISGVTVFNPGIGRLANATIVIHDGRIVAVRARMASDPAPICPGCFAMPGLIDAHVHTPPWIALGNQRLFALLDLEYGVTTVRDLGQSDTSIHALADDLNSGRIVGPHMYRCGPVLDGEPPGWPSAWKVTTAAEGRAAVDALVEEKVDCIKVYNEVNRETYDAIAAEAARVHLPMIGHVPHRVGLTGMHDFEAQHLTGVPYLRFPLPPVGVDVRGEDLLAMTSADIDHALDVIAANRISLLPTLANPGLRLIASDPRRFPPTPGSRNLPDFWKPVWSALVRHPTSEEQIGIEIAGIPRLRLITGRAHARGIDVLAGTDIDHALGRAGRVAASGDRAARAGVRKPRSRTGRRHCREWQTYRARSDRRDRARRPRRHSAAAVGSCARPGRATELAVRGRRWPLLRPRDGRWLARPLPAPLPWRGLQRGDECGRRAGSESVRQYCRKPRLN